MKQSGSEHTRPAAARSRPGRPRISVDPRRSDRPPPGNHAGMGAYPADTRALARIEAPRPDSVQGLWNWSSLAPHPGDTGSARRRPSTVRIPPPVRSRHQVATPGAEQVPASRRADLARTHPNAAPTDQRGGPVHPCRFAPGGRAVRTRDRRRGDAATR